MINKIIRFFKDFWDAEVTLFYCRRRRFQEEQKLRNYISTSIHRQLRRQGSEETYTDEEINKVFDHLWGINAIPFLKTHLEYDFHDGMNWENFNQYWELDHITPQSVYPYQTIWSDNFRQAWQYNNLRPATKKDILHRQEYRKIFFFDIDGTIMTNDPDHDYTKAFPFPDRIARVNELYEAGHTVILFTARGSVTDSNHYTYTVEQLRRMGVKFTDVLTTKPYYDIWVDDRAIGDQDFFYNKTLASDRFPFLKNIK